jgi:hypothetical protein
MDGMIGGVGKRAEERRGRARREQKGISFEAKQSSERLWLHSHALLIPANYLFLSLSLVIPLSVHHNSLYRWE